MRHVAVGTALAVLVASAALAACSAPPSPSPAPPAAAQPKAESMTKAERIKADAIDEVMKDGDVFFLDVREPKEIQEHGSYEGYVNIPLGQLESRLAELPRDRPILTA